MSVLDRWGIPLQKYTHHYRTAAKERAAVS